MLLATVLQLSAGLIHRWRTPGPNGVWLMAPETAAGIAAPAARIVSRHAPIPDVEGSEDIADVVEIAGHGIGYVTSSVEGERAYQQAMRPTEMGPGQ